MAFNYKCSSGLVMTALALGLGGCQDLAVVNPNAPDRTDVTSTAADLSALLGSGFRTWFARTQESSPNWAMSSMADEFTSGQLDYGIGPLSIQPRPAFGNTPVGGNTGTINAAWNESLSVTALVNAAIRAIEVDGVKITESGVDHTQRALAFGKFVQGLTHAYVGSLFDQGYVYTDVLDTDTLDLHAVPGQIKPYTEVMDTAMVAFSEALALTNANDFTLPPDWIPGYQMSSTEFARLIHTYMARYMVYGARTPAERAAVDWDEVINHIDQGITENFAPLGSPDYLESLFKYRIPRQRSTFPGDFARVDYMLVGPADITDQFLNWYNAPWLDRVPFKLVTTDARIGTNDSTDRGLYIGYNATDIYAADRGTGQRSYYYVHRVGEGTNWQNGPLLAITLEEMALLKAEGLIRLGLADQAADLINESRVDHGDLPPVTVDGVPGSAPTCIPRKLDGSCGSLWDALRYEKRIEGIGTEGAVAFYDARGWGALEPGTPIQFPIPGPELELLEMPIYTFGGGGEGSAGPWAGENCPVDLPRCP